VDGQFQHQVHLFETAVAALVAAQLAAPASQPFLQGLVASVPRELHHLPATAEIRHLLFVEQGLAESRPLRPEMEGELEDHPQSLWMEVHPSWLAMVMAIACCMLAEHRVLDCRTRVQVSSEADGHLEEHSVRSEQPNLELLFDH